MSRLLREELRGGKFGHGFIAAGFPKAINMVPGVNKLTSYGINMKAADTGGTWGKIVRTSAAATIGGTASKLAGGKFANGAVTASFSWLLNAEPSLAEQVAEHKRQQELTYYSALAAKNGISVGGVEWDTWDSISAGLVTVDLALAGPTGEGIIPAIMIQGFKRGGPRLLSAGWKISLRRYPKAGGIGMDFGKFRLDWHRIRLGGHRTGKDYNLPHLDIPGKTKHWPWHQIDKWWRGVN